MEFKIKTVTIGRIGQTKRHADAYARMVCKEFGWDKAITDHIMDGLPKANQKIHMILGK